MLTVATYLWFDPQSRHNGAYTYGPDHVHRLRDMVAKNLTLPHEFACITDSAAMFDPDIRIIRLDRTTHVPRTCFVRLQTFSPMMAEHCERILQLDLDTAIVGSLDSIVSRTDDIVLWRNPALNPKFPSRATYNGSVVLHRCGTRTDVWSEFDPEVFRGREDQDWYSAFLGPDMPYWDHQDGIYRLAREDTPGSGLGAELPDNARIVTFVGSEHKPWIPAVREAHPWIKKYWPEAA